MMITIARRKLWAIIMVTGIALVIFGMILIPLIDHQIEQKIDNLPAPSWNGTGRSYYRSQQRLEEYKRQSGSLRNIQLVLHHYAKPISITLGWITFGGGLIGAVLVNVLKGTFRESSIQEKIRQLSDLKEKGLLSEEEFEERKKKLLLRL